MKNRLPKAQKGLAKLAKVVKTASKTAGKTKSKAAPVVRKAKRIGNAQKSLSKSALSGMTASQLRSKLSSLMKEASAASKAKSSAKKLALKQKGGPAGPKKLKGMVAGRRTPVSKSRVNQSGLINKMDPRRKRAKKELEMRKAGLKTKDYAKKFKETSTKIKSKMQAGGSIGVKPPASLKPKGKEKRRLKKNDRRADRMIKKGGDKAMINQMREMAKGPLKGTIATKRQTKKFVKNYKVPAKPVPKTKMQSGGPITNHIGKLTPAQKKFLKVTAKKSAKNPPKSITPPGMAKSKKDLKRVTRKGSKTVTSRSGLVTKVNRAGKAKKNQGGGRPMSAKRAVRKMTRKRG